MDKSIDEASQLSLLLEELDSWEEVLGYTAAEDATVEEKLALRRQHVVALLENAARSQEKSHSLTEYLRLLADLVQHINVKSEGRVLDVLSRVGALQDLSSTTEDHSDIGEQLQGLYGALQFQDIQRQELEAVEKALRGMGEYFDVDADHTHSFSDLMAMLPAVLEALLPRTDIDAVDVPEDEAGPPIELF